LEYSSEVWDNCGQVNSDRLEKLQLEAARIVTGLTCYTSLDSIYREAGWGKLSTRREVKKLCMLKVDVFSGLINSITWSSTEKMTVGISVCSLTNIMTIS
jgi:hypothetical protein